MMPGLAGEQVAKQMKRIAPRVPIIMFTGYAETTLQEGTSLAHIDLLLAKPTNAKGLQEAIEMVMEGR